MQDNIVPLPNRPVPVNDSWFAQLEARLSRIEAIVAKVESLLWLVIASFALISGLELIRIVTG